MGELQDEIRSALRTVRESGKIGKSLLQPLLCDRLTALGLEVDAEDEKGFLAAGKPVWRSKRDNCIEATLGRRRIDIVVRDAGRIIALIETESDLNDLRETGVSGRSGHYDVFSIARNSSGHWFHSYKSLERMAAALWYHNAGTVDTLERVASDDPQIHNPQAISIILVSGQSRALDRSILRPRLASLRASLLSVKAVG